MSQPNAAGTPAPKTPETTEQTTSPKTKKPKQLPLPQTDESADEAVENPPNAEYNISVKADSDEVKSLRKQVKDSEAMLKTMFSKPLLEAKFYTEDEVKGMTSEALKAAFEVYHKMTGGQAQINIPPRTPPGLPRTPGEPAKKKQERYQYDPKTGEMKWSEYE